MIKKILPSARGDYLVFQVPSSKLGFIPDRIWFPEPSIRHRTQPYILPHKILIGNRVTPEAATRFTPPPFAAVIMGEGQKTLFALKARKGWHLWNFVEFKASSSGIEISVDLEGHTNATEALKNISMGIVPGNPGEKPMQLLSRGTASLYPWTLDVSEKHVPEWWLRPIYCGWGDQVATSLAMEGPGQECRAMAYCIQGLYERWIKRLEESGVPVGTVIIDAGWSPAGTLEPNRIQWPDLRGFIQRQHDKNRRVLLWLATFLHEGLPDEWCIYAGKTKLVTDPGNNDYLSLIHI